MQAPAQPTTGRSPGITRQRQEQSAAAGEEQQEDFSELISDISTAVSRYCSRRPRVAAGCLFSLGFIFGWKLRPW